MACFTNRAVQSNYMLFFISNKHPSDLLVESPGSHPWDPGKHSPPTHMQTLCWNVKFQKLKAYWVPWEKKLGLEVPLYSLHSHNVIVRNSSPTCHKMRPYPSRNETLIFQPEWAMSIPCSKMQAYSRIAEQKGKFNLRHFFFSKSSLELILSKTQLTSQPLDIVLLQTFDVFLANFNLPIMVHTKR